jgi:WD40 repeat protein
LGLEPGELSQAVDGIEDRVDNQPEGLPRGLLVLERPADGYQVPDGIQYEVEKKEKVSPIPFVPANTSEAIPLDAPRIDLFCGRENEIADLQKWIVNDASPLVLVYGLGGIGKTTLTARLFHQHKHQFDSAGWFPLQDSPPLEDVLGRCIRSVFNDEHIKLSTDVDELMKQFVDHLRKGRYLLVFDNFESVLPGEKHEDWHVQNKYANYGKLLKQLVASDHHSCVLLTSREKPRGFGSLEARKASVHALQLQGVSLQDVQEMLAEKRLQGSEADWSSLIQRYSGNPLALKLVAEPINELFKGDIASFLREGEGISIFDDLSELLDQQFNWLSEAEKEVMYWLAIANKAISLDDLQNDVVSSLSKKELPETFNSLLSRSLVQSQEGARFELQPVIHEYVTARLIDEVYNEILSDEAYVLGSHALMQVQAREYIREGQVALILKPLVKRLQTTLSRQGYATKLKDILQHLREGPQRQLKYVAGNILNLLIALEEPISEYDFSGLFLSQAFLQGARLTDVNFSRAHFEKSIFIDTFGSILSTDLNTDGSLLAAGTMNCEVRIWQTTNGALTTTCKGHTDWVRAVAFNPDGRTIASASEDTTLRLWEVETGQLLHTLVGHEKRVYTLAFNKEGTLLASGGEDGRVFLWEKANGWQPRVLEGHTGSIRALAISSESLLATGSRDETIRLWRLETGECVRVLESGSNSVRALAFSPDGSLLVSGENDGAIRLWEVRSERAPELLGRHHDRVYTVAFSPDGKSIASGSEDRLVRLWRVGTLGSIQTLDGHSDRVRSVKFTPDGKMVVSGSEDHTALFWDLSTGLCVKRLQGYSSSIHTIMFNHRGTILAVGGEDWRIRLWRVSDGSAQEYKTLDEHKGRVRAVAFNPSDTLVASGSEDRTIRLWDAESGRWLKTLSGHGDRAWSVEFSPLGNVIASGSEDRTIRLWNVRTGEELKRWYAHQTTVRTIAFHPKGTTIASGGEDQSIRLWDVETMQCLKTLRLPLESKNTWSIAFSPNGTLLASGSEDGVIRVWNVQSGELLQEILAHEGRVWSVAFNSTNTLIASGGEDRTVGVWKARSGESVVRFNDHENRVRSVCFKPHTQHNTHDYIASGSHDGTVKLGLLQTDIPRETLRSDRPYERMDITDVTGDINAAQRSVLLSLGAIENIQGGTLPL